MFGLLETFVGGVMAGIGFAVGVGATMAGAERARPLARSAVKNYLVAVDRAREITAGLGETIQDIYAEARAEREAELRNATGQKG